MVDWLESMTAEIRILHLRLNYLCKPLYMTMALEEDRERLEPSTGQKADQCNLLRVCRREEVSLREQPYRIKLHSQV
jgi:hypothetical protein